MASTTAAPKAGRRDTSAAAPKAGRRDTSAGRFYQVGDNSYPSVTTILDAIAKPALVEWAATTERAEVIEAAGDMWESLAALGDRRTVSRLAYTEGLKRRLGAGRAWKRLRDEARRIGTEMHDLIHWHLARLVGAPIKQPTTGPEAVLGFQAFARWLEASGYKPVWVEFQVWSDVHGYAGTLDTAGNLLVGGAEVAAVGDWKSSRRIYAEAVMQVSAYLEALREMGHLSPEAGPVWGFVLRLPKREGDEPAVHIITPEQQRAAFKVFLATLQLWRWLRENDAPPQAVVTPEAPVPAAQGEDLPARAYDPAPPALAPTDSTPATRTVDYRVTLVNRGWWICPDCDIANGPTWPECQCGRKRPEAA
jgi:hypothetical protein